MGAATNTITVDPTIPPDVSERYVTVYGTIAVSASTDTYTNTGGAHGNPLSFAGKTQFSTVPVEVRIWSETPANAYGFRYITGTTNANGTLAMFTPDTDAEITNATATNAAISGDTKLRFAAVFRKG